MAHQFTDIFLHGSKSNLSFSCRYCHNAGIGWAVSDSIDLSSMLDLVDNCDFMTFLLMIGLCFVVIGIVNFDLHELALLRLGIRGGNKCMETSVSVMMLDLGQPLEGVGGPA